MMKWLAPVMIIETSEMGVMAAGAVLALDGRVEVKSY